MIADSTGKSRVAIFLWLTVMMSGIAIAKEKSETLPPATATTDAKPAKRETAADQLDENSTAVIVITATRTEHRVDEVAASVSVVTEKDFAHKHRQNVEDMLRDLEGLDFSRQASVAHQGYPTIRGVGGSFVGATTQVLIDGVAQDAATSNILGHGGLNFLDMQDIERIEVVRGPVSALYGYGAIGGVVNIIPKRWTGQAGGEINANYGSNETWTGGGAIGTATDDFDIRISFYDARSNGFITRPKRDAYGQIDYGPRDWTDRKFSLNGGYYINSRQEIGFSFFNYETDSAINGGDRPFDRQTMTGSSARLGYRYDLSNTTTIKAQYQLTRLSQKFRFDEEDWNGDIGNFALGYSGARYSNTTGLSLELDSRLSHAHRMIAGISHEDGNAETHDSVIGVSDHITDAIYVQDEYTTGPLILTAGIRYDRIDLSPVTSDGIDINGSGSVDNVLSPRIGAVYTLSDATSFYASAGTAFLPALNKFKFVQPSTTRVDNPDLDPETSVSFEIGMRNNLGWGRLRTAIYRTSFRNKIALGVNTETGLNQWQNIALRRVLGLEVALQGDLGSGWYPYANYSHTKAQDQASPGAAFTDATRVAPNKFNIGFTYESGSTWSATLNGRWVDAQYFNNLTKAQKADSYFQADALARAKLPGFDGKLDAYFACNNIGDKKYQPFNIDEWSDGRTFTAGINAKF